MGIIKDCSDAINLVAEELEKTIPEMPKATNPVELANQMNLANLASTAALLNRWKPGDLY